MHGVAEIMAVMALDMMFQHIFDDEKGALLDRS